CDIVSEAKETLLISLWAEELEEIKAFLPDKNIKTAIVHFGKTDFKFEKTFIHPIEDTIYDEKKGRGFVIVKDSKEVLIGTIDNDKNIEGAHSANKAFVTIAEDYIKHDIYIMKIVSRFNDLLIEKFGDNYKELRDIFNDKSF
ncbi:MAG TPA: hypothetical protein PLO89_12010, partial [Spirochaetota bacterium]|nr:hypothetical protein [Spirochaetota bacterium]